MEHSHLSGRNLNYVKPILLVELFRFNTYLTTTAKAHDMQVPELLSIGEIVVESTIFLPLKWSLSSLT